MRGTAERTGGRGTARLEGIEGARAVAAFLVLAAHAWYFMGAAGTTPDLGWLSSWVTPQLPAGVALFFCLSGFLLYRPFAIAVLAGAAP
jgi:peptidoglycan/LPS O-acetylase OafA/YrhL